jgi:hypothetical protein
MLGSWHLPVHPEEVVQNVEEEPETQMDVVYSDRKRSSIPWSFRFLLNILDNFFRMDR